MSERRRSSLPEKLSSFLPWSQKEPDPHVLEVIPRDEWGALPTVKEVEKIDKKVPYMFVHHSAWEPCSTVEECKEVVRKIQEFHMCDSNRLWNDIGYSFLIGGDGNIYEGRGWGVVGAHTLGFNRLGYGTCFIGNFIDTAPGKAAVDAYMKLLEHAVVKKYVQPDYKLFRHPQAINNLSQGDKLYDLMQSWPHWAPGRPEPPK